MKQFLLSLALAGTLGSAAHALPNKTDVIPTKNGAIRITPIYHGSLQIEYRGKVIHVDPFSAGDYRGVKKADVILITHTHPDHLDLKAIANIRKRGADVIMPPVAADAVVTSVGHKSDLYENTIPLSNREVEDRIVKVEAVPMYNVVRGPKPGEKFHPKGRGNGYILTLGDKRIYIAGDTEATPEMKALKNIDIAFLPMNLPYTMTPQEAAAGARAFKPKVVYPYHYRFPFTKANDNPQQFAKALVGSGIQVRLRGWYAHPAK